jgi:hypothetical protein
MQYIMEQLDKKLDIYQLVDWRDNHRVSYVGPWRWVVAYSRLLNDEEMRLDGVIGGSVPQIDRVWPLDRRHLDLPMPLKGSVPNVLRH